MKYFKVFDIFRSRTSSKTFFLLVKDNLLKVNPKMYEKILKGYVYKYDTIKILEENEESGIIFEISNNELIDQEYNYNYLDYIYNKYNLLPFLTDTLPYFTEEIINLCNNNYLLKGRIVHKTRINNNQNKIYLFYILEINNELVKGIVWKENLKYSSLNINDEVLITKYRNSKGYKNQGHIENNEFSELSYFDIKEIVIMELFLNNKISNIKESNIKESNINESNINESNKIINIDDNNKIINKDYNTYKDYNKDDNNFINISGIIKYRSVLNRKYHYGYSEYYLLNVEDNKILLFYNSDLEFYKIEAGNKINIYNLKEINRNGFIFYISTIFTQFEYKNIEEKDERISTFLYENDNKRRKGDEEKDDEKDDDNNSNIYRYNINHIKDDNKEDDDEILNIYDGSTNTINDNDSSIMINLEIITHSKRKLEEDKYNIKYIESAYGYLPDNIKNINNIYNDSNSNNNNKDNKDNSNKDNNNNNKDNNNKNNNNDNNKNNKYTTLPFFIPKKINIEELESSCNNLVINESNKFIVKGRIKSIEKYNEEYSIKYIDTGNIKDQYPVVINLENNISFYIFNNFFTGEIEYEDLINKIPCKIEDCINKEFIFIIHVFRASIDHVIYSISEILNI